MKKHIHSIDDFFFKKLNTFQEDSDKVVWDVIEKNLNKQQLNEYKKRYRVLVRTVICTVLLFLSLLTGSFFKSSNSDTFYIQTPISQPSLHKAIVNNSANNDFKKAYSYHTYSYSKIENHAFIKTDNGQQNIARGSDVDFTITNCRPFYHIINNKNDSAFYTHSMLPNSLVTTLINKSIDQEKSIAVPAKNYCSKSKGGKFFIGALISPDVSGSRLSEQYEYNDEDENDISSREKRNMSYSFGLVGQCQWSDKWSFQSGLVLSTSYISIAPTVVKASADNAGNYKFKLATTYGLGVFTKTGNRNIQNGDSINLNNTSSLRLQYLSIPINVKYRLSNAKIGFSALAGIGLNQVTSEKLVIDLNTMYGGEKEVIHKLEGLRNIFLTVNTGIEASYTLNKQFSASFSPILQYAITPINKNTPIKNYPVTASFSASLNINL